MKKICYALFGSKTRTPENSFEFFAYMRGLYFNVRMNKLIYPDWISHVEVDVHSMSQYDNVFLGLAKHYGMTYGINQPEPRCKAMLWRMKPLFEPGVERILCRDADAITTYREAQAVKAWEDSGHLVHAMTDNPAHTPGLMGGMIGFKTEIKNKFGWLDWAQMLSSAQEDFSIHGADQNFLAKKVYPEVQSEMLAHYFQSPQDQVSYQLPNVNPALWESNLTCRHIGSAGVVEMETLRFFQRFDKPILEFVEIEKRYPDIFYWHHK